jgi:hypothetical protein
LHPHPLSGHFSLFNFFVSLFFSQSWFDLIRAEKHESFKRKKEEKVKKKF